MRYSQSGIGGIQLLLVIVLFGAVTYFAAPIYQDYVVRTKMAEAFTIVADAKTKLREFYTMKRRFPKSDAELKAIETEMFSAPKFVDKVVLNSKNAEHELVIQVHFQADVIPGDGLNEQFLYVAGDSSIGGSAMVEWSCGLSGIDEKYLPARCEE